MLTKHNTEAIAVDNRNLCKNPILAASILLQTSVDLTSCYKEDTTRLVARNRIGLWVNALFHSSRVEKWTKYVFPDKKNVSVPLNRTAV